MRGRAGGRAREPGWIPRADEARGVRLRWCVFKVRVYAFVCRVRMCAVFFVCVHFSYAVLFFVGVGVDVCMFRVYLCWYVCLFGL